MLRILVRKTAAAVVDARLASVCESSTRRIQALRRSSTALPEIARELYHLDDFKGDFNVFDHVKVYKDVITFEEEKALVQELHPQLKQKAYQGGHWDKAISGFRETEHPKFTPEAKSILDRMYDLLPQDGRSWLTLHVLDLHSKGIIFPHVDSLKFSGDIVAGLSLYSDSMCTFQLHRDPDDDSQDDLPDSRVQVLLPRRSFYITSGPIRRTYAHGIRDPDGLPQYHNGLEVPRKRRISVLYRDALPDK